MARGTYLLMCSRGTYLLMCSRGTYLLMWNVFVIFGLLFLKVLCVRYVPACSQKDIANVCVPVIYLYVIKEYTYVSACGGRKG
jgi:hypothetical protein